MMQGVGAFCPTTMTLPEARLAAVCRCTAAYCKERHPGAQVAGIYLEGPFLAPERRGSHDEALLQTRIRSCSDASRRPEKGLYG